MISDIRNWDAIDVHMANSPVLPSAVCFMCICKCYGEFSRAAIDSNSLYSAVSQAPIFAPPY